MIETAPSEWEAASVSLRVSVGDRPLATARLRTLIWRGSFLATPRGTPRPPKAKLPAAHHGYYFQSFPVAAPLTTVAFDQGYLRFVPQRYRRFYTDLSLSEDAYRARFSGKTRSTLRRRVRKFAELCGGKPDFRVYRTAEQLAEFRRLAVPLSSKTYQERLFRSGLPDDDAFWSDLARRADNDGVRAYLLCLRGAPVAYLCCSVHDGAVMYDFVGFAAEHREHAPGNVLQWLALSDLLAERKFRLFDFTPGEGPHKELFSTGWVECADVFFLRPTPRILLLVAAKLAVEGLATQAGAVAERLGVKSKLRAFLRGT